MNYFPIDLDISGANSYMYFVYFGEGLWRTSHSSKISWWQKNGAPMTEEWCTNDRRMVPQILLNNIPQSLNLFLFLDLSYSVHSTFVFYT